MKHSADLSAGFDVVRRYDPELGERMQARDWEVTSSPADVLAKHSMHLARTLAMVDLVGAAAGTVSPLDFPVLRRPLTYVSTARIEQDAHALRVPASYMLALTLAHEFAHAELGQHGHDHEASEPPAFRAGEEFARKLPAPYGERLAVMSERSLKSELDMFAAIEGKAA